MGAGNLGANGGSPGAGGLGGSGGSLGAVNLGADGGSQGGVDLGADGGSMGADGLEAGSRQRTTGAVGLEADNGSVAAGGLGANEEPPELSTWRLTMDQWWLAAQERSNVSKDASFLVSRSGGLADPGSFQEASCLAITNLQL